MIRSGLPGRIAYGALAQLVARYIRIVEVTGSNPVCSTILEKSELNPSWGWVRISSFSLEYCGVINRIMEGDETVQSATRCNITLRPEPQESEEPL